MERVVYGKGRLPGREDVPIPDRDLVFEAVTDDDRFEIRIRRGVRGFVAS